MFIDLQRLLKSSTSPPKELKAWLNYETSLTEKLKAESGEAELRLLRQAWFKPNWWEKFTLGLERRPLIQRDILMYSQQIPCWFARTIIPEASYLAQQVFFDRLEQESLGELVFNDPCVKRIALVSYAINESCQEYYWPPNCFKANQEPLWLRLSIFTIADATHFFLAEILLPGLMRIIK